MSQHHVVCYEFFTTVPNAMAGEETCFFEDEVDHDGNVIEPPPINTAWLKDEVACAATAMQSHVERDAQ